MVRWGWAVNPFDPPSSLSKSMRIPRADYLTQMSFAPSNAATTFNGQNREKKIMKRYFKVVLQEFRRFYGAQYSDLFSLLRAGRAEFHTWECKELSPMASPQQGAPSLPPSTPVIPSQSLGKRPGKLRDRNHFSRNQKVGRSGRVM